MRTSRGAFFFLATGSIGRDAARVRRRRAHAPDTARSAARAGTHTVAPSSIERLVVAAGLVVGDERGRPEPQTSREPAGDRTSQASAKIRASTRATLPSTSGSFAPNAMLAIAPAV